MRSLPTQAFLQTHETLIAYHKVIDQFNIEMLSCCDQLLRHSDVFWRWSGIATWVIMTNNDCGAVAYDCWPVNFSGTEHRAIDRALVTADVFHNPIFCVEN